MTTSGGIKEASTRARLVILLGMFGFTLDRGHFTIPIVIAIALFHYGVTSKQFVV